MNAKDKKKIKEYINTLEGIKSDIETMQTDEENKHDNLPEGLQESERGEAIQAAAEALGAAVGSLEETIDSLNEIA